jgi:hypothetical protein
MKTFAQILLIIIFIIFFISTLVTSTFKFVLLNRNFWISAFTKNDVYSELSMSIKNSVNQKVNEEGGDNSDITVLTDLITPDNTRDFIDNNLYNVFDFINGKVGELIVYFPFNRVPKDLLPKSLSALNNEMTLNQISEKFSVTGLDQLPLSSINKVGETVFYSFIVSAILLITTIIFLILSTEPGKRFIALGIAFILSGIITFVFSESNPTLALFGEGITAGTNLNNAILAAVAPPLIAETLLLWKIVGVGLVVLGVVPLLIKKSDNI